MGKSKEIWKTIPGFSRYKVSNLGRVKSFVLNCDGKIMSQSTRTRGHKAVNIVSDYGMVKNVTIHCLVAFAFIGKRPKGKQVCHWDCNPANNNISNLRYGTQKENGSDTRRVNSERKAEEEKKRLSTLKSLKDMTDKYFSGDIGIIELTEYYAIHAGESYTP